MPKGTPKNGVNKGWIKKGQHLSLSTELKKGHKLTDVDKLRERTKGNKNPMYGKIRELCPSWKGEDAKYLPKHNWVRYWKGKPKKCIDCNKKGKMVNGQWNIHWSNIDHKYKRVLEDYIGRCPSCHRRYDIKNNLK